MSDSNIYIIIYIAMWAVTFICYWRKKRFFGAGNFIIASYLLYAVISFVLYNHNQTGNYYGDLKLFPYIYLFIMLLVFVQPVLKYDEKSEIQIPSYSLIKFLSYAYIISSLIVVPILFQDLKDALMLIAIDPDGGEELYLEYHNRIAGKQSWSLFNLFMIVFNFFSEFGVLLFFLYISLPSKKKVLIILMLISIIFSMLNSLSHGQRTGLTMKFLLIITTYFLFRYHLSQETNKIVTKIGVILCCIVLFFVVTLNYSRYSNRSYDSSYQLINYSGQASLNFNNYGLDAGGIRNGDRTLNLFKKWLGFDGVPKDVMEVRNKYSRMKLNDRLFSTYVGDFTLDFGPYGAAFILCSLSLFFLHLTRCRNKKLFFHQLIIVYYVMAVTIQGGMYLFYYSFDRNVQILYCAMLYFVFKFDAYKQQESLKYLK